MKFKTVIFIILLLVLVAGTVFINDKIDTYGYDTNFDLEPIYGDQGLLDGAEIRLQNVISNTCFWDSRIRFDNGKIISETSTEPEESYIFADYYDKAKENNGFHQDYDLIRDISGYLDNEYNIFDEVKKMGDEIKASDKIDLSIKPSDYCDNYKINWSLTRGRTTWSLETVEQRPENDTTTYDENLDKFTEFFKIPIVKDETYSVERIVDDDDGREKVYYSVGRNYDREYFDFAMNSAFGNGKAFMYFDNRTSKGNRVDTSLIPGGYGIYSFDFGLSVDGREYSDPDMGTLRVILPLDEDTIIKKMFLSSDEKYLYIFTIEDRNMVIYVMDTDNCEVVSEKVLWEDMDREEITFLPGFATRGGIDVYSPDELGVPGGDLAFAVQKRNGFRIIKLEEDQIRVVFTRKYDETDDPEKLGVFLAPTSSLKCAWDEENNRLILAVLKHALGDDEPIDELNKTMILVYKDGEPGFIGKLSGDINEAITRRTQDDLEDYVSEARVAVGPWSRNFVSDGDAPVGWVSDDFKEFVWNADTTICSLTAD